MGSNPKVCGERCRRLLAAEIWLKHKRLSSKPSAAKPAASEVLAGDAEGDCLDLLPCKERKNTRLDRQQQALGKSVEPALWAHYSRLDDVDIYKKGRCFPIPYAHRAPKGGIWDSLEKCNQAGARTSQRFLPAVAGAAAEPRSTPPHHSARTAV